MHCFYHGDVEAVAVCKSCGNGICHDCCAEVGTSAACRNRCESDVEGIDFMTRHAVSLYRRAGSANRQVGWVFIGIGAVLMIFGAVVYEKQGIIDLLIWTLIFGGLLLMFGILRLRNARRFSDK